MGKQLGMFETEGDALSKAQAEMRLQQMRRDATKPTTRHHRSVATTCPSCGACVTIRV